MFSFFKSTKKSPVVSPTVERTDENTQKNSDEFVVVNPVQPIQPQPIYPPSPYGQYNPQNPTFNRQFSITSYTQSVPFKLNPVLTSEQNDTEIWSYRIREMNSMLNKLNSTADYNFNLERSIIESN